MRVQLETGLFVYLSPFFFLVGTVYGFLIEWSEPVGFLALYLTGGLTAMVGFYLGFTGKRVGDRPEDRLDAEIHDGSGEQGHFSPGAGGLWSSASPPQPASSVLRADSGSRTWARVLL